MSPKGILRGGVVVIAGVLSTLELYSLPASSSARNPITTSVQGVPRLIPHGSDWLAEINLYRTAAGLRPVTNNPSWDAGILDHLTYMIDTPLSLMTGPYESLHTENPASPYYTGAGAVAGASSDLEPGNPPGTTPVQAIDGWLEAPFHASAILQPSLGQVAFAYKSGNVGFKIAGFSVAGLNWTSGLNENPSATAPVLFPGPDMTTNLTKYAPESPSPLETCGWSMNIPPGLPLIAQLTNTPSNQLKASLHWSGGSTVTSQNGRLCVVDTNHYLADGSVYAPRGSGFPDGNSVFLIPKSALQSGTYTATISQPGLSNITWSFHVAAPPMILGPSEIIFQKGVYKSYHLRSTGGQGKLTWFRTSGALPAGLTLKPSGVISGTPTVYGIFGITINLKDQQGNSSGNVQFSIFAD